MEELLHVLGQVTVDVSYCNQQGFYTLYVVKDQAQACWIVGFVDLHTLDNFMTLIALSVSEMAVFCFMVASLTMSALPMFIRPSSLVVLCYLATFV